MTTSDKSNAPKPRRNSANVQAAADRLDQASREATFAAKVQLTRATGKKADELDPGMVKRVAEPIFQQAAGELIANGELGLAANGNRPPVTRVAAASAKSAHAGDLKSLLHLHKDALDALPSTEKPLTPEQRAGIKAFFTDAHPRMRSEAVMNAKGDQPLTHPDRVALTKIVEKDRRSTVAGSKSRRSAAKNPDQGDLDLKGGGTRIGHAERQAQRRAAADRRGSARGEG